MGHHALRLTSAVTLAYLAFFPMLAFAPIFDDWVLHWGAKWDPAHIRLYWLHPASLVEALALAPIIPITSPLWWHIGIVLKALSSYAAGSLAGELFRSRSAGLIVTVISSASSLGMEAIGFMSAHAVYVAAIGVFTTLTLCRVYFRTSKPHIAVVAAACGIATLLADPFRSLYLFPLLIFVSAINPAPNFPKTKAILALFFAASVVLIIFLLLYRDIFWGSNAAKQPYTQLLTNAGVFLPINLGRLMAGWLVPVLGEGDRFVNKLLSVLGFLTMGGAALSAFTLLFAKLRACSAKEMAQRFSFIFIVSSFLPNWLFQPHVLLGNDHRYFAISSIGVAMLAASALLRLTPAFRLMAASFLIVLLILGARLTLNEIKPYRSMEKMMTIWKAIDKDISHPEKTVLYFTGEPVYKNYYLNGISPHPLVLWRGISRFDQFPQTVYSLEELEEVWCRSGGAKTILSYQIESDRLINNSASLAKKLSKLACGV